MPNAGIFSLSSYYNKDLSGDIPVVNRESYREYGYFLGQFGGQLNRIDFSNDTAIANRRTTVNQYFSSGTGNSNFGYIAGGNKSGFNNITDISRIDYSNDINVLSRGGLTSGRNNNGAAGNSNFGYIAGGTSATAALSSIERINYSNDNSLASIRGPLTIARYVAGTGNSNFGYFGGTGPVPVSPGSGGSTVDRVNYSNDTPITLSRGNLQNSNFSFSATGNNNFGYFLTGWGTSSSHRLNYANDTALLAIRGNLSFPKYWWPGSTGNSNFGYSAGGSTTPSTGQAISIVDRIDYSNDLATASVRGPLSANDLTIASTSSASFGGSPNSQYGVFPKPFGYFGGGSTPAISTVERIDYTNDTNIPRTRGPLSSARYAVAAAGNSNFGYFAGGFAPGAISTINRIDYNNDTSSASTRNTLLLVKSYLAATGNSNFGYFGGGYTSGPATFYSTIERLNYSNDTQATSVRGSLSLIKYSLAATGNSNFGYFGGGNSPAAPGAISTVDRIDYNNDTATASTRGTLVTAKHYSGATGNNNFGYFGGGANPFPTPILTVDRIDYSNDTATASPRAPLSSPKYGVSATGSSNFGYFGGGREPSVSTVDRIDYSNDTATATIRGPLSSAKRYMGSSSPLTPSSAFALGQYPNVGITTSDYQPTSTFFDIQSMKNINDTTSASVRKRTLGSFGYWIGGGGSGPNFPGYANRSFVHRVDFSNDTVVVPIRSALASGTNSYAGVSNNNFVYRGGGDSAAFDRIDIGNDTATNAIRGSLSLARSQLGAAGNKNFGYFAGGFKIPAPRAYYSRVDRLDYSTDTTTARVRGSLRNQRLLVPAVTSNQNFVYVSAGANTDVWVNESKVERISYSNDGSTTLIRGPLASAGAYASGTGNNNYGYVGATSQATSIIARIDYSNDLQSPTTRTFLQVPRRQAAATGNADYGYFGGGGIPSVNQNSSIERIDYSNDTLTPSSRGPLQLSIQYIASAQNSYHI